jgi:hypothetical protein
MPKSLTMRPLALVEDDILNGDLLLFRGHGLIAQAIQWGGRSEYSHAAMACWWMDQLFCLEVREWVGGRAVTLASQVERYPGCIDVYRADHPEYIRSTATDKMKSFAGCDYGYLAVLAAALTHLPFVRKWASRSKEAAEQWNSPPYCSQAIAIAAERAGVDPVPNLDDRLTEPGDLARSSLWDYWFTLE